MRPVDKAETPAKIKIPDGIVPARHRLLPPSENENDFKSEEAEPQFKGQLKLAE